MNLFGSKILTWVRGFSLRTVWAAGAVIVGVAAGVGSASYSLSVAGLNPPKQPHSWQEWNLDPDSSTLIYALGHFLAADQMPPSRTSQQFIRMTDRSGTLLKGECTVTVSGTLPKARWWTLEAATLNGKVKSRQSIIDAGMAVLEADQRLIAAIANEPRPGNWIASPSTGAYMLIFTLHDPAIGTTDDNLPDVKVETC